MGVVTESLDVEVDLDVVWRLFIDPDRWLEWNTELADMRDVRGPFDRPGTGYTQVWRLAGIEREGSWRVTGCDPGRWRTVEGVTPIGLAYQAREAFERLDGGTRVTVQIAWTTPGGVVGTIVDAAVGEPLLRSALRSNSRRIRDVLMAPAGDPELPRPRADDGRTSPMTRMVTRQVAVAAPAEDAWAVLADLADWPTWAGHLRRVDAVPPGPVTSATTATLYLTNRTIARVAVTEFDAGRRFRWAGTLMWLALDYDHVVDDVDGGCRITFVVDARGAGVATVGRLFARIYERNLDRACPRLARLVEARNQGSPPAPRP